MTTIHIDSNRVMVFVYRLMRCLLFLSIVSCCVIWLCQVLPAGVFDRSTNELPDCRVMHVDDCIDEFVAQVQRLAHSKFRKMPLWANQRILKVS